MKVKIVNNNSEIQNILSDDPLGSILRPLLILMFITDSSNDIKSEIELRISVDDVKLLVKPSKNKQHRWIQINCYKTFKLIIDQSTSKLKSK